MSVHPPKRISSHEGLGVGTKKHLEFLSASLAIGTEIWNKVATPWREGKTIIAAFGYTWVTQWEAGKPYIISKFYNAQGDLVGTYCDVARPVRRTNDGFEFDDLYLDVWQVPGKKPVILDEDELDAAVIAGYVSKDEAKAAQRIAQFLVGLLQRERMAALDYDKHLIP